MATWRYIKGSEKDFEGAPEWALCVVMFEGQKLFEEHTKAILGQSRWQVDGDESVSVWDENTKAGGLIIAQRERVTSINDDRLASDLCHVRDGFDTPKPKDTDNVNHPKHYTQGGIECIDAIKAATVGKSGIEAVCVANVVKYLWRYEEKNGVEDVKKARWYLERLISELESGK